MIGDQKADADQIDPAAKDESADQGTTNANADKDEGYSAHRPMPGRAFRPAEYGQSNDDGQAPGGNMDKDVQGMKVCHGRSPVELPA
ncbi:hypothetical protein AEAC466_04135 [Asticcacaulis sp. AC466]|nr:hypothetical protein AEAC466_04135 [Asticcacaulis sp. AC466]